MLLLLILPDFCIFGQIVHCPLLHTFAVPGIIVIGGVSLGALALTSVSLRFLGLLYPKLTCLGRRLCLVEALSAKMGQFFLIDSFSGGFWGL